MPPRFVSRLVLAVALVAATGETPAFSQSEQSAGVPTRAALVLWRDPGRLETRDLKYGPGTRSGSPAPPFRFVREETSGRSAKFVVRDARKVEWVVKLGPESQAETVATRLLWAVGYFADEAYYMDRARVRNLPVLSRGEDYVRPGGVVVGARFEPRRAGLKRLDPWEWDDNPFVGTRQLDGLRVMMALLNNWDARDENNVVVLAPSGRGNEARFVVSDLGASFGRTGGPLRHSKNEVEDFVASRFVEKVEDGIVHFDYNTRPSGLALATVVYPPYFIREFKRQKEFDRVPVAPARWIGSLLSRLTTRQLRDAFAAAGYTPTVSGAYIRTLRDRIHQLVTLPPAVEGTHVRAAGR